MRTGLRQRKGIRRRQVLLGAVSGAALAATLAGALPAAAASGAAATAASPSARTTANVRHAYVPGTAIPKGGEVHGVALTQARSLYGPTLPDIPQLASDGVNLVNLYVTEYQKNLNANTIQDGPLTPNTAEVGATIDLAHSYGMAVELMPVLATQGTFHWRGAIWPSNVSQWFTSYTKMIDKWAQVAQDHGAEIFSIGSELEHTQQYTRQWRKVAGSVRGIYHGTTTYMADSNTVGIRKYYGLDVKFWNSVDLIGQSPYYSLTAAKTPSVAQLQRIWRQQYLPAERRLSRRWHRPILFDEIGYESVDGAAHDPYQHSSGSPNQQAQANAYQALIDVTHGLKYIRGVVFFTWTRASVPAVDTSYTPAGKKAECVMAMSWSQASSGTPTACVLSALS